MEDDHLSQRLVTMIFTRAGHEVLVADTVAGGMEQLRRNPSVDLVVIDNHLGVENGWSLAREIRRYGYLKDVPIVTYTGSRDRDVVLRYLELGVQAFHLKPYRAEVLLAELERAHASGRRERLWESPEATCRRLKLTAEQYAGLLNSGAGLLEQSCQTVRKLMLSNGDSRVGAAFRSMAQQLSQLGINIVVKLAEQAEEELRRADYAACSDTLGVIDQVAAHIRNRALKKLSMGDSVVSGLTDSSPASLAGPEAPWSDLGDPAFPVYARAIIAQPVGAFGSFISNRGLAPLFAEGKMQKTVAEWSASPGAATWFEAIRWLDGAEQLEPSEVVKALVAISGYDAVAESFLARTGVLSPSRGGRADWSMAVNKLGVPKAAVLTAAGRVCASGAGSGPLPLAGLIHHAVTMLLLGYELGRLLRLTHPLKIAGAALGRNLGLWTLAQGDPLLVALVLARGRQTGRLREAQQELLKATFGEAGAKWLELEGLAQLYQDVARGESTAPESEVTTAVVDMTEQIAHAVLSGAPAAMDELAKVLTAADHPVWASLRRRGSALPADPVELVGMTLPLARSAAWIAGEVNRLRPGG